MKWIKFETPYTAKLIKDVMLYSDGKIIARGGKDNPIEGKITHHRTRKIGRNSVRMYLFHPDADPNNSWEFSRKCFKELRKEGENA